MPFLGAEMALGCAGGQKGAWRARFLEDRWYLRDQELRRNLAEGALPQAVHRA